MQEILSALSEVYTFEGILTLAAGVVAGIIIGALPGLSVNMAISLLFPFAYAIDGIAGINMLLGVYCGAVYGGSISAILLHTPGTPGSVATMIDGYPMTLKGEPGRALGISTFSSTFGGIFSTICLVFFAPLLAKLALKFTSLEYCAFALFGISIISSVSTGSVIKGIIGGVIGLLLACIGVDPISGMLRYTFNSTYLMGGISFLPLLIGLLAFSQVLVNIEDTFRRKREGTHDHMNFDPNKKMRTFPTWSDIKRIFPTLLGCSVLGTFIGCVPGTGGDIACFMAYTGAKKFNRKHHDEFGKGAPEGIAAPESANNAVCGGAMIPMLSLGIPGDGATAILLGALMVKSVTPGPLLFTANAKQVYQIFGGMGMANVLMFILGFLLLRVFIKVVLVKNEHLLPMIVALCVIGTYSYGHNYTDIIVMLISGIIGYFAIKHDFTMSSVIIGFILGTMTESNFRRYIMLNNGNFSAIFERPIAVAFFAASIITMLSPVIVSIRNSLKARKAAKEG